MCSCNSNNELYHYGVLGMKWGKRRLQNRIRSDLRKGLKIDDQINKQVIKRYNGPAGNEMTIIKNPEKVKKLREKQNRILNSKSGEKAVTTYIQKYGKESFQKLVNETIDKHINSKLKNVAATAVYGHDSNGVRNDLKKNTAWNEKHSRSKGNI